MRIIWIVILVIMLMPYGFAMDQEKSQHFCYHHGGLPDDEVIEIEYWGEEYYICEQCVTEFIMNNQDEVARLVKDINGRRNNE